MAGTLRSSSHKSCVEKLYWTQTLLKRKVARAGDDNMHCTEIVLLESI